MQIVIDISEKIYNDIRTKNEHGIIFNAVKNGTPLPKEHGRIMDVDKIIKKMEEREEQLKDDRAIYETACVETALDIFGETIIEADKETEE